MEEEGRVDREHGRLPSQHPDIEWSAKAITQEEEEGAKT